MKIWWSRVISNEKLWEMTGQISINKEIRKRKFGWIGHTLRKDDKFAGSQVRRFYSQWKFITLKAQYTTLDYSSQLF
jgi:hypothetical protein